jgi:hypothetical protein
MVADKAARAARTEVHGRRAGEAVLAGADDGRREGGHGCGAETRSATRLSHAGILSNRKGSRAPQAAPQKDTAWARTPRRARAERSGRAPRGEARGGGGGGKAGASELCRKQRGFAAGDDAPLASRVRRAVRRARGGRLRRGDAAGDGAAGAAAKWRHALRWPEMPQNQPVVAAKGLGLWWREPSSLRPPPRPRRVRGRCAAGGEHAA